MKEQYPLRIRMNIPKTGSLEPPIYYNYDGIDPFATDLPGEVVSIKDELQYYKEIVQGRLIGNGTSLSGGKEQENFVIEVRKNSKDFSERTTDVTFEATFKLPGSQAPIASERHQYSIYPNNIGIYQEVFYEDFGVRVEERVIRERFMNSGDLPTLDLILRKLSYI